jgi:predicted metal-binding protein
MDYETEVYVKKMKTCQWLKDYCFPDKYVPLCKVCPDYGKTWSCPPGTPSAKGYLDQYEEVFTIGVKILYHKDLRESADTPEMVEKIRKETYGAVKLILMEILLYMEKENPGSLILAPGRCEQCETCSRIYGLPCKRPERMRYSFAAFGFDFTKMSQELFGINLLWSAAGLPEYNLAIAALLINKK